MGHGNHLVARQISRIRAFAQAVGGGANLFMAGEFSQAGKDYGNKVFSSIAMIHPAFIALMLNRIYSQ
jgi:hypothetical protein